MTEDVELCLEVQVDPASKRILSNPQKCRSALLDVTVVKPKEVEAFGTQQTNTLRAAEVRKLLTSLEKQRRKKQKVLDKLKYDDTIIRIRKHEDVYEDHRPPRKSFTKRRERISSNAVIDDLERKDFIGIAESVEPLFCEIRRSLKNVETRITDMQDINLVISETDETATEAFRYTKYKNRSPLTSSNRVRNHSIFRMETAPHDLKSMLISENKCKLLGKEKVEGKCLCENCGIVGLLTECQKHPLLTELSESPVQSNHRHVLDSRKKTKFNITNRENLKSKNNDPIYINQLTDRVKLLEQRLAIQEERVVPKDYFKKIVTKMVSNFSPKLFKSKSDTCMHCTSQNARKSLKNERCCKQCTQSDDTRHCKSTDKFSCCNACSLKQKNVEEKSTTKEKPTIKEKSTTKDKWTTTDDDIYFGGFIWKWGEEILKPGIDLKNRIVTLLNEILSKFSLGEKVPEETPKNDNYKSETYKKFVELMNTKIYNTHVEAKPNFLSQDLKKDENIHFEPFYGTTGSEYSKIHEDKLEVAKSWPSKSGSQRNKKSIDVSYINPKLSLWRTESPRIAEKVLEQKGRQEFLKIVFKAKQNQKDILWKNIWNQAKANNQTKKDKITIKIPCQTKDGKGKAKMFETDITIGEVEKILKGI